MENRNLGRTGLKVSRLCLGTMTFGWSANEQESFNIMDAAIAADITFFDTADVYSRWVGNNVGGECEVYYTPSPYPEFVEGSFQHVSTKTRSF